MKTTATEADVKKVSSGAPVMNGRIQVGTTGHSRWRIDHMDFRGITFSTKTAAAQYLERFTA